MPEPNVRLGSPKTVQKMLDCSEATLRRLRKNKKRNFPEPLYPFEAGGHPRFDLDEVGAWIASQRSNAGALDA